MERNIQSFFVVLLVMFLPFSEAVYSQTEWKEINAGSEFSMGIKSDGTLWAWGFNGNGAVGIDSIESIYYPVQVGMDTDWTTVSAGGIHTLALKEDGSLWAWGFNGVGSTGTGTSSPNQIVYTPTQVGFDTDWIFIHAGYAHSLAIKADSSLWGWGYNFIGQVDGSGLEVIDEPILIDDSLKWKQVEAGGMHSLALTSDGHLYSWGFNGDGQLGNGTTFDSSVPGRIDSAHTYMMISAGMQANYAIRSDSTLWAWGFNGNYELGTNPSISFSETPLQVGEDNDWVLVKSGSVYGVALKEDMSLYGWGSNLFGQLGMGGTTDILIPTRIGDDYWTKIAPASGIFSAQGIFGGHTLGLKDDKSVICAVGANYIGQLGDSTDIARTTFACDIGEIISSVFTNNYQLEIKLYPNPASDEINIEIPELNSSNAILSILNNTGQTVFYKEDVESRMKLQLSDLPSGLYFLIIRDRAEIHSRKFLISR